MLFYRWLSSLLRLQVVVSKLLQIVLVLRMPDLFNFSLQINENVDLHIQMALYMALSKLVISINFHVLFIFICLNCILISSMSAAYTPLLLSCLQNSSALSASSA